MKDATWDASIVTLTNSIPWSVCSLKGVREALGLGMPRTAARLLDRLLSRGSVAKLGDIPLFPCHSIHGVWGSFANMHGVSSDPRGQLDKKNSSYGWSNGVFGANAYAMQEMCRTPSLVGDTCRADSTVPARLPSATIMSA